jgi:acetyl esterase/lipase
MTTSTNPAGGSEIAVRAAVQPAAPGKPGAQGGARARAAEPATARWLRRVLTAAVMGGIVASAGAAELRRDLVYGEAGGERLLLDASVPEGAGPFPVAILIHGGGWNSGDKSGSDQPGNGADITPWFAPLTAAKFVWFSINYRHAPKHRWPACFEDVQTAVRWVKAHAAEHKGDPDRIVLLGHSAGGHLALMLATQSRADTRVQAVVGFAPVSDHEQDLAQRGGLSTALQQLLGLPKEVTPASLQALRAISPVNRVRAGMPPMLLLHGDADKTVPLAQSQAWQRRMRSAGNACDLIVLKGAPHALIPWEKSDPTWPAQMTTWLRATLAAAPAGARK